MNESLERGRPSKIERWKHATGDLVDRVRKITYPGILSLGLILYPHFAQSAHIDAHATYSQGIELLQDGAQEDDVETSATHISIEGGKDLWTSFTGAKDKVGISYEKMKTLLVEKLKSIQVAKGDVVTIEFLHTHPVQSALHHTVFGGSLDSTKTVSVPPSNGYLDADGDTSGLKDYQLKTEVIEQLQQMLGVTIRFEYGVVDALGKWQHGQYSEEELQKTYPEIHKKRQEHQDAAKRYFTLREEVDSTHFIEKAVTTFSEEKLDDILRQTASRDAQRSSEIQMILSVKNTQEKLERERELVTYLVKNGYASDELQQEVFGGTRYAEFPNINNRVREHDAESNALRDKINALIVKWAQASQVTNIQRLVKSPLYTELVEAHAAAGIKLSYSPFSD